MKHDRNQPIFAGKTIVELEALTAGLDRPFVIDQTRSLTPAERRLWERAKRKRGRPKVGEGAEVVSVSIERGLLTRSDRLARKLKVSRARLIAVGLEKLLDEQSRRQRPRRGGAADSPASSGRRRKAA